MFDIQKIEIKAILAAVVLLIIVGLGFGTYYFHEKYVSQLIVNGDLKTQNTGYIAQLQADSDAVAKLAADSKAREEAAATALLTAQATARNYQKKAENLLSAIASNPNNLCLSADALFNQYIEGK